MSEPTAIRITGPKCELCTNAANYIVLAGSEISLLRRTHTAERIAPTPISMRVSRETAEPPTPTTPKKRATRKQVTK